MSDEPRHNPDHPQDDSDDREVLLDDPALPAVPLEEDDEPLVGDAVPAPPDEDPAAPQP